VINKLAEAKKSDEDVKKSSKSNVMNPNEKNTITLGDFLELLDGIVEIPGRMIIMTSNHPEILDPALIRPGRVDIVIEFKKLSKENVADMYKLWFGSALDEKVYKDMKDYAFTQADIGNLFASRKITDIHAILRQTT
jgi:ATP-dependent 26S proteasome regulatory subunit